MDKDKEIKRLNKNFDLSRKAHKRYICKLKNQLANKNVEIAELKKQVYDYKSGIEMMKNINRFDIGNSLKGCVKDLSKQRHDICKEIRDYFEVNYHAVDFDYLNEILNHIEYGENKNVE